MFSNCFVFNLKIETFTFFVGWDFIQLSFCGFILNFYYFLKVCVYEGARERSEWYTKETWNPPEAGVKAVVSCLMGVLGLKLSPRRSIYRSHWPFDTAGFWHTVSLGTLIRSGTHREPTLFLECWMEFKRSKDNVPPYWWPLWYCTLKLLFIAK